MEATTDAEDGKDADGDGEDEDDDASGGGAMHRSAAPSAMMPGCSATLSSSHTERSAPSGARVAEGVADDGNDDDENEAADASLLVFECGSINSSHCEANKQHRKQKTHDQITLRVLAKQIWIKTRQELIS